MRYLVSVAVTASLLATVAAVALAPAAHAWEVGTPRSFTTPPAQQFQGHSGVQYTFQKSGFEGHYDAGADVHRPHHVAPVGAPYGAPAYVPPPAGAAAGGYAQAPAYTGQPMAYVPPPAAAPTGDWAADGYVSQNQRWHPASPFGPADVSAAPGYQPPVSLANYVTEHSVADPHTGQLHISIDPDILFEFSKFDIRQTTASQTVMGQLADVIRRHGQLVTLSAHTDWVDEQHFNFHLSQKRAISIRNWLITHGGIAPNLLEIEAHGEMYPVASNAHASGRAMNRHVSVTIHNASDARIYQRNPAGVAQPMHYVAR